MTIPSSLIVLGGSGLVGDHFAGQLRAVGRRATFISRRGDFAPAGHDVLHLDINDPGEFWRAPPGSVVVSFLALWITVNNLHRLQGARSVIATGSTSMFSKSASGDAQERETALKLERAESDLAIWADGQGAVWTVLRPTLIYDGVRDVNIARMAAFIRRHGFLPLAWPANGLRQPIHGADVARAALLCLDNPAAAGRAFNIAGGETLTYRRMAARVSDRLGRRPRFLTLPLWGWRAGLALLRGIGRLPPDAPNLAVFARMNQNLIFDVADSVDLLGCRPRPFEPEFKDSP